MRFTLVAASLVLGGLSFLPDSALAARRYGMAGCGLGSVLMGPNGSQVSAATTNGSTFANQLWAITFGTSNCLPDEEAAALIKQENFVATNLATLSKEAAQGQGETVVGLANVLGCNSSVQQHFSSYLQARYETVFAAPGAMAVLDTLKDEIQNDGELARACTLSNI